MKAKQVIKHCIEKARMSINYDTSEFDGSIIVDGQPPISKHPPITNAPPSTSSTSKNFPSSSKEFVCSIWLV